MNTTFHRYNSAANDRAESTVPAPNQAIEIVDGEISGDTAGELLLHFGPVAGIEDIDDSGFVAGGLLAAGGGSARFKGLKRGPLGVGLFSSNVGGGDQTVGVHYKIVTVKPA